MSITKIGLVFAVLIYSILLINSIEENRSSITNQQRIRYSETIRNTLNDTSYTMLSTLKYDDNIMKLDIDQCLRTFKKTLSVNMNFQNNDVLLTDFMNHVPLILFVEGDGVSSYALTDTGTTLEHVLHEKRYFTHYLPIDNVIVKFSFEDYYEVHDITYNLVYRGTYAELKGLGIANTLFSQAEDQVIDIRKQVIMKYINKELLRINDHNHYAKSIGIGYKFYIPQDDTNFNKAVTSPGIITFIQGVSLGKTHLNISEFAAATVVESEMIEGYDNLGNLLYYEASDLNKKGTFVEIFSSKKEAAKVGYFLGY